MATQQQAAVDASAPPEVVLERRAASWPERAQALLVTDQDTHDRAAEALLGIKALRNKIADTFDPICKKAFEAHKAATFARNKVERPLEEAETILRRSISTWRYEQERIAKEEQRRLQQEAVARAEQEREHEVEEAEAAGASSEEIAYIAGRPFTVPPVAMPPAVRKVEGITSRENWKAEVTNMQALIRHIAADPKAQFIGLIQSNQVAINTMARALKSLMAIPGIRVWNEAGIAVRGGSK